MKSLAALVAVAATLVSSAKAVAVWGQCTFGVRLSCGANADFALDLQAAELDSPVPLFATPGPPVVL